MDILDKIWSGNTVYQEPVCFTTDEVGMPLGGKLLYPPAQILSVASYDDAALYQQQRDYALDPRGIRRTEDSRIPFLPREVYCRPYTGRPETAWVRLPGGVSYMEVVGEIYRWQTLITYRHAGEWNGPKPASQLSRLPRTARLLREGGRLNLVFYGDSITAGWEASGCDEHAVDMVDLSEYHVLIRRPPGMPAWAQLVTEALARRYPRCSVQKINRAAGGSTTGWGAKNAARLVSSCVPDLVVLAFGMNSMQDPPEQYRAEIEGILFAIRRERPQCEFLLVSPMIPNPEIAGFQNNQLCRQQAELERLCESCSGVGLVKVHDLFCYLLQQGKTYWELTGNCINHPNDFSIRLYAQCVLAALEA